jgi:hypothetical protein
VGALELPPLLREAQGLRVRCDRALVDVLLATETEGAPGPALCPGRRAAASTYGRAVKLALAIAAVVTTAALGAGQSSARATARPCIVPRLTTLTLAAAEARLTASGCKLAGFSYQRPRTRSIRVTDQVPAPGAILFRSARVFLIVS